MDLDGDGHSDVLITDQHVFTWYASLAEDGFDPARRVHQSMDEESSPQLVFADGTQSLYLADISGDGLTDLVRIQTARPVIGSSLGYGRFSLRVLMDNSPWLDNPRAVRTSPGAHLAVMRELSISIFSPYGDQRAQPTLALAT